MKKDVTNKLIIGQQDDGLLVIRKCVCGHNYDNWDFTIRDEENSPHTCDNCHRRFFFTSKITVFEVTED